jgi:hypothetical protein
MGDIRNIRPDLETEDDDDDISITFSPPDVVALSRVLNFADGVLTAMTKSSNNTGYLDSIERDVKLLQTRIPR